MANHIKQVEKYTNIPIQIIDLSNEIIEGFKKYGFPHFKNRWCTGLKRIAMNKLVNKKDITYVGMNADEGKRTTKNYYKSIVKFPLFEMGLNNNDVLNLCYSQGFNFGGIYNHHKHFNCWCCPLQSIKEIEWLYRNRPELWKKLNEMLS